MDRKNLILRIYFCKRLEDENRYKDNISRRRNFKKINFKKDNLSKKNYSL